MTISPPWSRKPVRGVLGTGRTARFPIDWRKSGIDPLNHNARLELSSPWLIGIATKGGFQWRPTRKSVDQMISMIGEVTDTEVAMGPVDGPVTLKVASLAVEGGALHFGKAARLQLKVKNEGPGTAYRVVARTRSGIPELHDLQFSFGILRPGDEKSRTVAARISDTADDESALIVVLVEDSRGGRTTYKQRFSIMETESGNRQGATCPTGLLTRNRYKEKLGRIKTMLETGVITQQDFDEYEASLLTCLE